VRRVHDALPVLIGPPGRPDVDATFRLAVHAAIILRRTTRNKPGLGDRG
jgi:hypothetical protein